MSLRYTCIVRAALFWVVVLASAASAAAPPAIPTGIDDLGTFLARKHTASVEDRKKVLSAIHAQVPDKNGRFAVPERKSEKEEKADDDLDWLAELQKLDAATPGLDEVIADDQAIRALAAS